MNNLLTVIKKYRVPIILFSLMVIVILIIVLSFTSKRTSPSTTAYPSATPESTPPPVPEGPWGKLDDLTKKLGSPIDQPDTSTKSGQYRYKSSTQNRPNEVIYQSNVPVFYKEMVTKSDNKTAKSITQKYGTPEIRLYGPESDIGFYLYAYPSKGIAYVGSIFDDIVTEVWYFSPTDLNTFMSTWAKEYSLQPIEGQF